MSKKNLKSTLAGIREKAQPELNTDMPKNVPLKTILYELNQQLDNIKTMFNNIILQMDAKLAEKNKNVKG